MTEPEPTNTEPTVETPAEDTFVEDASDAKLRAWAKDNGIDGVPGKRVKLSDAWREKITNAMAAALNPKAEASAKATSSESSISVEKKTAEAPSGETDSPSTEEPVVEYRSVFQAPDTFVSGQAFTA